MKTIETLSFLAQATFPQSTLDPAGQATERLADLGWLVYTIFTVVTLLMWGLIVWVALRRRGSLDRHAPVDAGGGQGWILVGGLLVPAAILSFIFIAGLQGMSAFPMTDGEIPAPEIRVTGHQWWWDVRYVAGGPNLHFRTANEIHIPVGRLVDIELVSADVIHSFWVPRLHGKVDLVPGLTNRIRIRADAPGVYEGQCGEFCGAQHAKMRLLVVAEPVEEYEHWLASQRQPASSPTTEFETRGYDLFMTKPCALCHTVAGTPARGGVAPDLTHLASRRRLAANVLENNEANLMAWITHAQSLKPEALMPNVTQFTGEELQAITAYLRQLE